MTAAFIKPITHRIDNTIPKRRLAVRTSKIHSIALFMVLALCLVSIPASANFPGKNGKIVFNANLTGTWQLYTIKADGTGMTQITNFPATNSEGWHPTFSPDGKKIAFDHDMSGAFEIYTINADGTGLTQLTFDNMFDGAARWSPDGTRIAFARAVPSTGQTVIATMNSDGSGLITNLTSELWSAFLPTYTPDGGRIVFESTQAGFIGVVWIMDVDGKNQERLTRPALEGGEVDISPNGEHILVVSHESTPLTPYAVFRMNLDGTDLTKVSDPGKGHHDIPGTYSPDGTKIVFASDRLSNDFSLDLFIMNADGSNIHRIASGLTPGGCPDTNCVTPSWGPKPAGN
jgi:Tol biopolymer transport system component